MKKNFLKIVLDVIMTVLLLLMYNKSSISLEFHELGGLIVFGLFIVHMLINWKWVVGVSKRLFDKSLPVRTKLGYVLNALLLVCMTLIIVSGIMMSKVLFPGVFGGGFAWVKMLHYFASAVAIIIVGIHIGLHWTFIKGVFGKIVKIPSAVSKPIGAICLAAIIIFGGYSIGTSSFTRFLTMPFITMSVPSEGGMAQSGERPAGKPQRVEGQSGKNTSGAPQNGQKPQGPQGEYPGGGSISFSKIINIIATFGSISFIFSIVTVLIEKLIKRKKQSKLAEV